MIRSNILKKTQTVMASSLASLVASAHAYIETHCISFASISSLIFYQLSGI